MGKTLLDGGNTLILCFENFNCLLLAFFRVHQKLQLWLNILTTKWYIFVQNKVALIIKSSKDSKNGAKCNHRPLHHSSLSNPLKKLWHRYFNIGASKFFEMYLKFIFSISPFMWIWNQSWKLTSLCTGLCVLVPHRCSERLPPHLTSSQVVIDNILCRAGTVDLFGVWFVYE